MNENEPGVASDAAGPPAGAGMPASDAAGASAGETSPTSPEPAPPVAVEPVSRGHRAPWRWGVALLVTVAVVAVASAALFFVSAGGSVSRLAGWVPPGTAVYAELRLEPPGDQGQRVEDLLARFPGFADRSQLDAKLTEALDRALGDASGGKVTYSSMKPWLGDAVAFAATPAAASDVMSGSGLLIVATKDAAAAREWLSANVTAAGSTTETYGGAELTTGTADGTAWAYAVLDTVVLAGEKAAVEAAIDTHGSSSFTASEPFRTAAASIQGDALGFAFVDTKAVASAAMAAGAASGTTSPLDQALVDKLPAWAAMTVRAGSDVLEVDAAAPQVAGIGPTTNRTSVLAPHLPAGTLIAAEVPDVGSRLVAMIDQLTSDPKTSDLGKQIEDALTAAGGADSTLAWMGDGTVALADVGGSLTGGLVVATLDEAAASAKLAQLRNLLALAGASSGITVTDEAYGDGTITTVDLGDLGRLAGEMGASGAEGLSSGDVRLAFTVQRGLFVVGYDDAFVKAVLDTTAGASLADQERYRTALDRAGTPNAGQVYVDIPGLLTAGAPYMSAAERSRFESDLKPFLDPLGAFAGSTLAGDPMRVRFVVTVE